VDILFKKILDKSCDLRYECKFETYQKSLSDIELILKLHPYAFSEIYHMRRINNIYFDTSDLDFYQQHVDGNRDRLKTRIRWYGERSEAVKDAVIEIKIRRGLCGYKLRYNLQPFNLNELETSESVEALLKKSEVPFECIQLMLHLKPVIYNQYERTYYQSSCGKFRTTLDDKLNFNTVRGNIKTHTFNGDYPDCVLEVKYDVVDDKGFNYLARNLPFRLFRHSKYIRGVDAVLQEFGSTCA